jgi:hypothetical protein
MRIIAVPTKPDLSDGLVTQRRGLHQTRAVQRNLIPRRLKNLRYEPYLPFAA